MLYIVCTYNICGQWRGRIVLFRSKRQASSLYVYTHVGTYYYMHYIIMLQRCVSSDGQTVREFIHFVVNDSGGGPRSRPCRKNRVYYYYYYHLYIYIVIAYPHDVYAARDPYAAARPKRTFEFRFQRARAGQKTENGVRPIHIHNLLVHIIIIYVPRRAPSQRKGFRRCSTARIYIYR